MKTVVIRHEHVGGGCLDRMPDIVGVAAPWLPLGDGQRVNQGEDFSNRQAYGRHLEHLVEAALTAGVGQPQRAREVLSPTEGRDLEEFLEGQLAQVAPAELLFELD